MEGPVKLLQRVRKRVQAVTYGSPLYRLMLDQGPIPDRMRLSLPDPWPGDAQAGRRLLTTARGLFDGEGVPPGARKSVLTHDSLRDLRAVGDAAARSKAVSLIQEWLEGQDVWDDESWSPDVLGARLANWISFYDFYAPQLSKELEGELIVGMVRQLRHLIHAAPSALSGEGGLCAIKGLVYGGLGLIDGERALGLGLELLRRQLAAEVLPDGGTVFRQPAAHAGMLRALIDIRAALKAARFEVPLELTLAIARMALALKALRHGDGALAVFNGGNEGDASMIDAIIALSEAKGQAPKRLPNMDYERLSAGRSLVLMDVGAPPPRTYDQNAHAGLLGFEFSVGRERLIVNCGAGPSGDADWRQALAATAAHSTIVLENRNACELLADGGIGARPQTLDVQRFDRDSQHVIEAFHDGYVPRQKVVVGRSLSLGEGGDVLGGTEKIVGPKGKDFTVRWHLHPDVTALLAQGGGSALMRLPSGAGWRLRIHGVATGDLALEPSIYCGRGAPRRTMQLSLSGRTREEVTTVSWSLTREKAKKGKD